VLRSILIEVYYYNQSYIGTSEHVQRLRENTLALKHYGDVA
jgi:hypothetical protein